MDQCKIDNFNRTYPDEDFPEFEALSQEECERLRRKLTAMLGLGDDATDLDVVKSLHAQTSRHLGEVPGEGQPDLRGLLTNAQIALPPHALLNWYRFDDIDRLDLDDLSRHFDDIWYPEADDIEIFDESCSWFLCVSHDGRIVLIQP